MVRPLLMGQAKGHPRAPPPLHLVNFSTVEVFKLLYVSLYLTPLLIADCIVGKMGFGD